MNSITYNYMEDSQLTKRFKSLAWRICMMGIVEVLNFSAANIGLFNLPPEVRIILGLLAGEVSKYITNRIKVEDAIY